VPHVVIKFISAYKLKGYMFVCHCIRSTISLMKEPHCLHFHEISHL